MVFAIIAKNATQATGNQSVTGRVTNAATGLYVVPAGRIARVISITALVDALGADASYACAVRRGGTFFPVGPMVVVNGVSVFTGEIILTAGDLVTNVGDAGSTNGTVDMSTTFQEFDV